MMVLMKYSFIFLELLQIFCVVMFLPGIGLPALLCEVIPELSKPNSSLFKNRLYWSVGISISGLIANELITIFTPGRGVFDWNDVLWTLIGAGFFVLIYKRLNRTI